LFEKWRASTTPVRVGTVAGNRARRLIYALDAAFADPFVLTAEDRTPPGHYLET
jgi:hypothetical protein